MAGTAKGYSVDEIHQGPGDLWVIGTAPVDATPRLTLATDGTPDATAHPSSIHLGLAEGGITTTVKGKFTEVMADQATAPLYRFLESEEMTIEAELQQQAVDKLQHAYTAGTYATASGYKQLTIGGGGVVAALCIAAISPKKDTPTLFQVSVIWKAVPVGGLQRLFARGKKSTHKIQFAGNADISRTAGKQIGNVYETIA